MFVQVLLIIAVMLTVTMLFYQWFGKKYDDERQKLVQNQRSLSASNSVEALSFGYPKAIDLILNANNYRPLLEAFRQADFDWQHRAELCIIGRRGYHPSVIQQWRIEQPTADAMLMSGIVQLHTALQLDESENNYIESSVRNALADLLNAAEQLPPDPTPWAYLINLVSYFPFALPDLVNSRLAQELNLTDVHALYAHGKSLDADNWLLASHYALSLSPFSPLDRDNESNDCRPMRQFAEQLADGLEEGDPKFSIVFRSLIDEIRWQAHQAASAENLIASSEQRDLGEKCANLLLGAGQSVDSSPTQFFSYCTAAAWFWIDKDKHKLPLVLAPINERIRPIHWQWLGLSEELSEARQFCGLEQPLDADF